MDSEHTCAICGWPIEPPLVCCDEECAGWLFYSKAVLNDK